MKILVINAGSSSLKYQLMDMDGEKVLAKGLCERIGIDGVLNYTPSVGDKPEFKAEVAMPTHAEALTAVIEKLTSAEYGVISSMTEIDAVGHRVAHGGEKFTKSTLLTDEAMETIRECVPLAPLHSPANIMGIEACAKAIPNVPQVGVFDTAFHQTMPAKAYTYAIPYEYYENDKVRRYGFHGTSHLYVAGRAAEMMGKDAKDLKLISCHMGNGTSFCAINGGISVDTTMGFTPVAGMPMGTRVGDLDSGILQFLMNKHGYSIDEMLNILNKKSGVLGVSGVSSDFRDLGEANEKGNERAGLALDIFAYQAAKTIGAYASAMAGVDGIIFTAGIGENAIDMRASICEYLGYLGCKLDKDANNVRGKETFISTADSTVKAMVIPTNEELVIARDTLSIVK